MKKQTLVLILLACVHMPVILMAKETKKMTHRMMQQYVLKAYL